MAHIIIPVFNLSFLLIPERGEERERVRERNIHERETLIGCLLYTPHTGDQTAARHVP